MPLAVPKTAGQPTALTIRLTPQSPVTHRSGCIHLTIITAHPTLYPGSIRILWTRNTANQLAQLHRAGRGGAGSGRGCGWGIRAPPGRRHVHSRGGGRAHLLTQHLPVPGGVSAKGLVQPAAEAANERRRRPAVRGSWPAWASCPAPASGAWSLGGACHLARPPGRPQEPVTRAALQALRPAPRGPSSGGLP